MVPYIPGVQEVQEVRVYREVRQVRVVRVDHLIQVVPLNQDIRPFLRDLGSQTLLGALAVQGVRLLVVAEVQREVDREGKRVDKGLIYNIS